MRTSVQLRGEEQIGDHGYAVQVRTEADQSVTVELQGQLPDGSVIAEGSFVLPVTDLVSAGQLIEATLRGLATVHNSGKVPSKSRPAPVNAGTPWHPDQDEELRRLWTRGERTIAQLCVHFGRSRAAIKARLTHLGLDPDGQDQRRQPTRESTNP
jgi:hypothetical protein